MQMPIAQNRARGITKYIARAAGPARWKIRAALAHAPGGQAVQFSE
jgi:hypothetical protein